MPIITSAQFSSIRFDYIIVGGGTAGLTLAARLTEDPDIVVGVIEAGGDDTDVPQITVPGMIGSTIANPKYDWTFFSVPQPRAKNRAVLQPRGKGLGGSSLINFLGVTRASKEEYDAIETFGNKGWNWDSFLKYMKKSETTIPTELSVTDAKKYAVNLDPSPHGTTGPIIKSFPSIWTEVHAKVFDTLEALGVPRNSDAFNGNNVGAMSTFASVDPLTATRSSAFTGYYKPNSTRKNLLVLTDAQVVKVLFETEEAGLQRAVGVELLKDGAKVTVKGVKRDVVLSAGTFQTPQLLELSGIGNPDILSKYDIQNIINLPGVGENLQDHLYVPTIVEIDSKYETMDVLLDPMQMQMHQELYKEQKGFLSAGPAPSFMFIPAHALGSPEDISSWQAHADICATADIAANTLPSLKDGLKKQYDLQRKWFADKNHPQAELLNYIGHQAIPGLTPAPGKRYTTLISVLTHPISRGTVHISSGDPVAPPAINPNYFANEADLNLLVRILQFTLKVYASPPLGDIFKAHVLPPSDVVDGGNIIEQEGRLKEWVKEWCGPVWHPVGTAAMMSRAEGGVVDSQLKVYGTSNLRVVDNSILPMELACHIQSAAYAIGEKAADIFKGVTA